MKREKADRGKDHSFYREKQTYCLTIPSIPPLRLLDVPSMGILSQSAATEVALFQSKRRLNGWVRCSPGCHGQKSVFEPLTLQDRFSGRQAKDIL